MRLVQIIGAAAAAAIVAAAPAGATRDGLTAVNVVPPGESGNTTLAQFTAATAGLSSSYGPHTDDQESLYANWQYKPFQFQAGSLGPGTPPPGDANVLIARDQAYGVPVITGRTDADTFYGVGYAMAQDRLFQMEVFRHVGHGTLASLIGASGIPMDEEVRRYTEGQRALLAEFHALPAADQQRLNSFVGGINAYIRQVGANPLEAPAEFTLLGDAPIQPWTIGDVLGFGEYAGRFFGEFGHGELGAEQTFVDLVRRYGIGKGERIFDDLLPIDDPHAPTSIQRSDGLFPRHTRRAVATRWHGSRWANQAPALLAPSRQIARLATTVDDRQTLVKRLIERLGLPRFGSNAVIVAPRLTRDHRPMLYGGPQTGWAVPGFFWEVELHSPVRDERGVMVPAIPLIVIGRSATTAWTVTSALDANEDVFEEQLNASDTTYMHDGRRLRVHRTVESIPCKNPPTTATTLAGGGGLQLCPSPAATITIYRTIHGPSIADPDARHQLFVRRSAVDGHLVGSLDAWDRAGLQSTARAFGNALRPMALGFNFFYIDDHGTIAYWHVGRYPVEPVNADPRLPLPGSGAFDWRRFESWNAHPHVVNPKRGFVVNWNNKPAVGWYSKNLETGGEGGLWGDQWESVPLAADVPARAPLTLRALGQVPRDVAYIDNPARVLLPHLLRALARSHDAQLLTIRGYLRAWNRRRDDVGASGGYSTPAVVFFDRFNEMLMRDVEQPVLGGDWVQNAGLNCATCHLVSIDNLTAPTYKFEYPGEQLLAAILDGHASPRWMPNRARVLLTAAKDAAAELTAQQGPDPSKWNEPVEKAVFSAQGAINVPAIAPLPNRGSYGQVVEATGAP